jgi:hypothetical protein
MIGGRTPGTPHASSVEISTHTADTTGQHTDHTSHTISLCLLIQQFLLSLLFRLILLP